MGEIINIEKNLPHSVSEVICLKCLERWIAVYPSDLWLNKFHCKNGHIGFVIKTSQDLDNPAIPAD
jgi:hypothetical protein